MISLFLTGDVMTGRGIDQALPSPCDPALHEPWVRDARTYVRLAEEVNGPIAKPLGFGDIWGEAFAVLDRAAPDARIVNLETSVTTSDDYWPGKGIHYRMHPGNVPCLTAAAIDCCVLANNHVLDFGYAGLDETLATLRSAGLACAGAGHDAAEASLPAVLDLGEKGRVLVFAFGCQTSGIPPEWAAGPKQPGVNLLPDLSPSAAEAAAETMAAQRREGEVVVASIHWGGNWGYRVSSGQRKFAHALVDAGCVDLVHGHSSHHARGIELYGGTPIIHGCGDFLTDYEGIAGHEEYRPDLALGYLVTLDAARRRCTRFELAPFRMARFTLSAAEGEDVEWLRATLARESASLGARVERTTRDTLLVRDG